MIEVAQNIYCFPVPLPGSPLKELNCYIVKGGGRNLMVDVGFNTKEGYAAVTAAFEELDISLAETDIFLTHLHADHTGLVESLKTGCGRIYISERDSKRVERNFDDNYWIEGLKIQDHMGFPDAETLDYKDHPAYRSGVLTPTDFYYVAEGFTVSIGGYDFAVIDLKGHTPGQIGLYDKEKSVLFCGDHILNKITPNINLWDFETDYLGVFLQNLRKVRDLNIKTLLSAHRALIPDVNARIDMLVAHHDRRLGRVLEILSAGKSTVYEVALEVEWDYGGGCFKDFPSPQKWFAASEVFAHLEHLRTLGKVELRIEAPVYHYSVI